LRLENAAFIIRNMDITWFTNDPRVPYYIEHQLSGLPFHDTEVSMSAVEDFLKTRAVSREISGVIIRYTGALIKGDIDYYLTTDEIFDITKRIEPELNALLNHRMTDDDHIRLAGILDDIVGFRGLTVGDITYDAGPGIQKAIPYLKIYPYLTVVAGLFCVITLCLIVLYHSKKISGAFLYAGAAFMLSGLVFLTVRTIIGNSPSSFSNTIETHIVFAGDYAWVLAWVLTEGFESLIMRYGIVLTLAGALSIAAYFVLKGRKL